MADAKGKGRANVTPVYISTGCNRYSSVADVRLDDGLVAYGAGKLIALWQSEDLSQKGVYQTLSGHTKTVTVVKFLQGPHGPVKYFATTDTAGRVVIWQEAGDDSWSILSTLETGSSIGALATCQATISSYIIAIGSASGKVILFNLAIDDGTLHQMQDIDLGGVMPMDIAITSLPNSSCHVMAVAGTSNDILLFTRSGNAKSFTQQTSLPGHTDWVRCLSFSLSLDHYTASQQTSNRDILLASGSQDNYIRLWRISQRQSSVSRDKSEAPSSALDILDQLEDPNDSEISSKEYPLGIEGESSHYACHAESVLLGHDGWVTNLHWRPPAETDSAQSLHLLSASADRSMILWQQDAASSIWLTHHRFGEMGGTNLSFFGALWGKKSRAVMAHGWGGSFHVWKTEADLESQWRSVTSITGHFDEVSSLAWEPNGDYLLTVSADQTTRLHAPWRRKGVETWHELSRPHIHGYDMFDIAFLSRQRYISGAEEKVIRVFDAPSLFSQSMRSLGSSASLGEATPRTGGDRPSAAAVPALGLSNKAVFENSGVSEVNGSVNGTQDVVHFVALQQPPSEEQLLTSTLWPETEKLYGHGYEISALAGSHDGTLIASACRSTTAEHAVIRIHRTSDWAQVHPPLAGHTLSIARIVFSPDDRHILSVSRDRSWQLYEQDNSKERYTRVAHLPKAHARIIWDAAWSNNGALFATASRDKSVKIWSERADKQSWDLLSALPQKDAATSVAFTSDATDHVLAVGLERGGLTVYRAEKGDPQIWNVTCQLESKHFHNAAITRLAWQPASRHPHAKLPLLASCSDDRSVRISCIS